jgi:hypothetical protein
MKIPPGNESRIRTKPELNSFIRKPGNQEFFFNFLVSWLPYKILIITPA